MSELWFELWKRPGHPTFGRTHNDIPATNAGIGGGLNKIGAGNFNIPDSWDGFDDMLLTDPITPANSVSSLVRVYSAKDPTKPIFEWLPNELIPGASKEDRIVRAGGVGIKGILGYARVEAFDWDGSDDFEPSDPDWLYGGNNMVRNPGFEDSPFAIPNLGFEDGTLAPWWAGAVDGVSATAVVQTAIVDTGTYAAAFSPLLPEGGGSVAFPVRPANFYTITARVRGSSGVDYQIGVSGPEGIVPVAGNSVKVAGPFGPGGHEVQHLFVGTGNFDTITLLFGSAGDQSSTQLSIREGEAILNGTTIFVDEVTVAGFGVGTDPWQPTAVNAPNVPGPVSVFEVSNTQASAGVWSLFVTAEPGHGAFQQINGIKAGVTYTAEVDIGFADVASVWALEVRDVQGNVIGQTAATIGTGAFTTLTATFKVPDFIPGSQGAVFMRVINYGTVARSVFIDEGNWFQGQPPDTIGKILMDLYLDATVNHAAVSDPTPRIVWENEAVPGTCYLLPDWTASVDSAGAAWIDPAISIRLTMRMSYSQVMAEFARLGYEYRIVPWQPTVINPGPFPDGIWLWQVYNPGTLGTDYTAAIGPAIQGGESDVSRSVVRAARGSTETMVEGLDRVTARARDAGLITALGRIEGNILDREVPDLTAATARAAEAIGQVVADSRTYSYSLAGDLADEPLTAYVEGDLLNIIDPPEVPVAAARFVDFAAAISPESVIWDVQFGSAVLINPDAAVADGLAFLLTKFEYPETRPSVETAEAPAPSGGGGAPTVTLSTTGSTTMSQGKADLPLFDGTHDPGILNTALGIVDGFGGRLLFTEGQPDFASAVVVVPEDVYFEGMGQSASILRVDNLATIDWTFNGGGMRHISFGTGCSV